MAPYRRMTSTPRLIWEPPAARESSGEKEGRGGPCAILEFVYYPKPEIAIKLE